MVYKLKDEQRNFKHYLLAKVMNCNDLKCNFLGNLWCRVIVLKFIRIAEMILKSEREAVRLI